MYTRQSHNHAKDKERSPIQTTVLTPQRDGIDTVKHPALPPERQQSQLHDTISMFSMVFFTFGVLGFSTCGKWGGTYPHPVKIVP
jgi:hypothetical protein